MRLLVTSLFISILMNPCRDLVEGHSSSVRYYAQFGARGRDEERVVNPSRGKLLEINKHTMHENGTLRVYQLDLEISLFSVLL